jgi:hypothetical protein
METRSIARLVGAAVLLLAVVLLPVPYLVRDRLPRQLIYHSEPMAEWFKRLPVTVLMTGVELNATGVINSRGQKYGDEASGKEAVEAFQFFGSNAVPFLMQKLQSRDSALETETRKLADKTSLNSLPFRLAELERQQAVTALVNLKPFPRELIPKLLALSTSSPKDTAWAAFYILKRVAPDEAKTVQGRWEQ